MSITYISSHDESIYDITKIFKQNLTRTEKYTSVFKKKIIAENVLEIQQIENEPHKKIIESKAKFSSHKTMGYAEVPCPDPCNFLRKNCGIKFRRTSLHKCGEASRYLPPIPTTRQMLKKSQRPIKNFKNINIKTVHNCLTKRPFPKVATSIDGKTELLCNMGIMPAYVYSQNFGKIPQYIKKIKKYLTENKYCEENSKILLEPSPITEGITMVSDDLRRQIILGLKHNWSELMNKYQKCPVLADTIPKKVRQRKTEEKLRQIEQDILLLENNPIIYICEDENDEPA